MKWPSLFLTIFLASSLQAAEAKDFYVELTQTNGVSTGGMIIGPSLKLEHVFGAVDIPMQDLHMLETKQEGVLLSMTNGDKLSGTVADPLILATARGPETFPLRTVKHMLFTNAPPDFVVGNAEEADEADEADEPLEPTRPAEIKPSPRPVITITKAGFTYAGITRDAAETVAVLKADIDPAQSILIRKGSGHEIKQVGELLRSLYAAGLTNTKIQ